MRNFAQKLVYVNSLTRVRLRERVHFRRLQIRRPVDVGGEQREVGDVYVDSGEKSELVRDRVLDARAHGEERSLFVGACLVGLEDVDEHVRWPLVVEVQRGRRLLLSGLQSCLFARSDVVRCRLAVDQLSGDKLLCTEREG